MPNDFKTAQAAQTKAKVAHELPPYSSAYAVDAPMAGRLLTNEAAEKFMLAGNATITMVSVATGNRYTYRIRRPKAYEDFWFVDVLKGSDNDRDFGYIGQIFGSGVRRYQRGKKCWPTYFLASDSFAWAWKQITLSVEPEVNPALELWHSGRCGRCARKLTVPASISSGFGPECINHVQ